VGDLTSPQIELQALEIADEIGERLDRPWPFMPTPPNRRQRHQHPGRVPQLEPIGANGMQNFFPTNLGVWDVEQEDGFKRTMQQNFAALWQRIFPAEGTWKLQKCNRLY